MRIVRCFSICLVLIFILKFYSITSLRRKPPGFEHLPDFNRSMTIWTCIKTILFMSKPVTFATHQNIVEIILVAEIELCLICIISMWLRTCVNTTTFIDFFINCHKSSWGILADGNSNITLGGIFDHTRIFLSIWRLFLYEESNNIFRE